MRRGLVLVVVAACGRVSFDPRGDGSDFGGGDGGGTGTSFAFGVQ